MIEESVEKQHTLADTSAREEDISPLPIKEYNESAIHNTL